MVRRRTRTALLVDFDNVVGETTAEFAHAIDGWLSWIEDGGFERDAARPRKRRLLVKRVYWNYHNDKYRSTFESRGFEAFVCVSRVLRGYKSTADMTIALDALALSFERPEIEEYVVLTADTDFVPLIDRLSDRGKRTAALAKDNASFMAYSERAETVIEARELERAFLYRRPPSFWARLRARVGRGRPAPDAAPSPDPATPTPALRRTPPRRPATPSGNAGAKVGVAEATRRLRDIGIERLRQRKSLALGRQSAIEALRGVVGFYSNGPGAYFGHGSYENLVRKIAETETDFELRADATGGVTLYYRPEGKPVADPDDAPASSA